MPYAKPAKRKKPSAPAAKQTAWKSWKTDIVPARRQWIPRLPRNGMADSKLVRLRYMDQVGINTTVGGGPVAAVFCANDLYDPNRAAGGHQPRGFDQMMQFYDHFTVIASNIKVTNLPDSTSNTVPQWLDVALSDASVTTGYTSLIDVCESRETSRKGITIGLYFHMASQPRAVRHSFDAKSFFNKKAIVGDSLYRGSATASPQEEAYYLVLLTPTDALADAPTRQFIVEIEYVAVLTEPKNLGMS